MKKSLPKELHNATRSDQYKHAHVEQAVDELNLAEFPIAGVSDRFLDGKKTVVFEDTVFCREQRRELPRRLIVSGSDRYGLPTAKDDDILLACIQLSKLEDFDSPMVRFSRYELIKLLGWADDTRNYQRVATSLRRWKGLSIFSDRAFYDHQQKSWVNRDFGVFDNLTIYRREAQERGALANCSSFVWNDFMYSSFKSGYLKKLDWNLYLSLESPVAKRLYRFLDKRFHYSDRLELDLRELAINKVRLSADYNVAQMKRALIKGFMELESAWEIRPLSNDQRFKKVGKGAWKVIVERKPKRTFKPQASAQPAGERPAGQATAATIPTHDPDQLITRLAKRGVGPGAADDLVCAYPLASIQKMIELFDWYNANGQARGAGFLVSAIKNPANIAFPRGFQSSESRNAKIAIQKGHSDREREFRTARERAAADRDLARTAAFNTFWQSLNTRQQQDFETEALEKAEPMKRRLYLDSSGRAGPAFELYRKIILQDHFQKQATASATANSSG